MEFRRVHWVGPILFCDGFPFDHHAALPIAEVSDVGRSVDEQRIDVILPYRSWFHLVGIGIENPQAVTHRQYPNNAFLGANFKTATTVNKTLELNALNCDSTKVQIRG